MSITSHLCFIYTILVMMVGTMIFDHIHPTHLSSTKITSLQTHLLRNLMLGLENRFTSMDKKLSSLRNDIFVDVMTEIKAMGGWKAPETTPSKFTATMEDVWSDDDTPIQKSSILSGFDFVRDYRKYDNYERKSTSKVKSKQNSSLKRNINAPSVPSNLKYNKIDTLLKNQKNSKIKQYDEDISFQSSTQRKLQESNLVCNGTSFGVEIKLDEFPMETSWKLIDVKANDTTANVSYKEEDKNKLMHEEICVKPGEFIFTLFDDSWDGTGCRLSSCYNIYIDNNRVIQGPTFQGQISHHFDSSTSSLCLIDSTFFLELRLDRNNSNFNSLLRNEVTGETFNLIDTPVRNNNFTNAFYTCLSPGIYVMDVLHIFDSPTLDCGSSDCFQVSINNHVFANGDDLLSLERFGFSLSNDLIARQRYCHRSPFLSFIDSVGNFPWNSQTSRIMDNIRLLSSHELLSNIHTPQYKAACRLLYDDIIKASVDDELMLERYALGVILYSTNRDAEMMLSRDSCELDGIACNDMGHIVRINWGGQGISSIIPSEISYLRFLEVLDLHENKIEGTLPSELGRLDHLKKIDAGVNIITGTIPTEIGGLINLVELSLDRNDFDGNIPSELGQCSKLESLVLHNNNLSGTIPSELFHLRQMTILELFNNILTGSIPSNIHQLEQLEILDLDNNHLNGTIPYEIGKLSNLLQIHLENNGLTGTVPSSFANLQKLGTFHLHNNKLIGSLPDIFDTMLSLDDVDFSNNTLTGSVPDALGNTAPLEELFLYMNEFTGSIPATFCSLNGTEMNIRSTKITGTVHEECCGSLNLTRDNSWFVEETLKCSCCGDAAQCYIWSVDDMIVEKGNLPPCPTNNIYRLDYFDQYWITDKILDKELFYEGTETWQNDRLCLSPTGCYKVHHHIMISGEEETETHFVNHDASTMSLIRQEQHQFDQCNTVHICNTSFNSTHRHRPKLNHLTQLAVPNMTTLHDTNPSYHDALCWIMTEDNYLDVYEICDGTLLQRYVMTLFFMSQNTTFTFDDFSNSTTCDWPGITCDSSNTFIQSLSFSNLTGTLITEIGLLQSLEVLDLSGSNLTGSLITEIGHLINLQTLDLSNNNFDGSIGSSIFTNIPKLAVFDISNNTLEGQIPKEIFEPNNLRQIILTGNAFVNTLPDDIVCSDSIEYFDIHNNLLRGSIPTALFYCKNLMHIDLSQNGFTGVIPANIGDSSRLEVIHLSENRLSGSIPVDLFQDIHIRELMLHSNELTGSIPTQVGNLPNATDITLNHNSFKGTIPTEFTKLSNIRLLHLHSNKLTGAAPDISMSRQSTTTLSFITDCGDPSYLIGTAVTCDSCTMCCNSDEQCQVTDPFAIPIDTRLLQYALGPLIVVLIFGYILWKSINKLVFSIALHGRDLDTIYSDDSVYCFLLSKNKIAWMIQIFTAIFQMSLFATYIDSSNALREDTDFVYTFRCPDNNIECQDQSSVSVGGWILFYVVTLLHLGGDFALSFVQILISIKTKNYHLRASGISMFIVTGVAFSTSIIYNMALAEKNTDLLTNAVILLFINDLDEKFLDMLKIVASTWTKQLLEEIETDMTRIEFCLKLFYP